MAIILTAADLDNMARYAARIWPLGMPAATVEHALAADVQRLIAEVRRLQVVCETLIDYYHLQPDIDGCFASDELDEPARR